MFNQLNTNFPVYYCLQPQNPLYNPFLLLNHTPFLVASYLPPSQQILNSGQETAMERQNWPYSQCGGVRKATMDSSLGSSEHMVATSHIIKEKIIKKPANRPSFYLTERKYYLTQPLPDNNQSERKLRPRKKNKKNRRKINISHQKNENGPQFGENQQQQGSAATDRDPSASCSERSENLRIISTEQQEAILCVKIEGHFVPTGGPE